MQVLVVEEAGRATGEIQPGEELHSLETDYLLPAATAYLYRRGRAAAEHPEQWDGLMRLIDFVPEPDRFYCEGFILAGIARGIGEWVAARRSEDPYEWARIIVALHARSAQNASMDELRRVTDELRRNVEAAEETQVRLREGTASFADLLEIYGPTLEQQGLLERARRVQADGAGRVLLIYPEAEPVPTVVTVYTHRDWEGAVDARLQQAKLPYASFVTAAFPADGKLATPAVVIRHADVELPPADPAVPVIQLRNMADLERLDPRAVFQIAIRSNLAALTTDPVSEGFFFTYGDRQVLAVFM